MNMFNEWFRRSKKVRRSTKKKSSARPGSYVSSLRLTLDALEHRIVPASPPTITQQPSDQIGTIGSTVDFLASAVGVPNPTIQWQVSTDGGANFTTVPLQTADLLAINVKLSLNNNVYRAVFTNASGTSTTVNAKLTVQVPPPTVNTNPGDQTVNVGTNAIFTASATGTPNPTVQWQVSSDNGNTYSNVPGATSATLTFPTSLGQNGNLYRAEFTNLGGVVDSSSGKLTVLSQSPSIIQNPADQNINIGSVATFSSSASGLPNPTVQWQVSTNGGASYSNILGATSSPLSIIGTQTNNGNKYRAVFSNGVGSANSAPATLTVNFAAPSIITNPTDQTVLKGTTATFTASANGIPTPTVQWQESGDGGLTFGDLIGETSPNLNIPGDPNLSGDKYRAVFTNSLGSATTTVATLHVVTSIKPSIVTNPTDQSVTSGNTATFTASSNGVPTPTVQWQVSTNGGVSFSNISGATSATLSFSTTLSQNGNKYRAVFSNSAGTATTSAALLTVATANVAPSIVGNPVDESVSAGNTATFNASANGTPTPTVQWQVSTDGGASFNNLSGATSPTLNFSASISQTGNKYRAVFSNSAGTATTSAATLTVINPNTAPIVATNPVSQSVTAGSSATFTASATGVPNPSVQWQVSTDNGANFSNLSGANSTTLSFSASSSQNGNQYRAVFSNSAGSATTSPAILTVVTAATAPAVITNPSNQTVADGTGASFSASATGTPTPTVQWQFSSDGGTSFNNVAGATSTTYTFTATTSMTGNKFRAVFTNSAGSATTSPANLTVTTSGSAPQIVQQPTNQTVLSGNTADFVSSANGVPNPIVQWQVSTDGGATFSNVPNANADTLAVLGTPDKTGNLYRAVFTNASGTATSNTALLTVQAVAPSVVTNPVDQTVASGGNAVFTASANGIPIPTVQWQVSADGGASFSNLSNANSTTLAFTASTSQNANLYRAVFTNSAGSATTSAARLTVTTSGTGGTVTTPSPYKSALNALQIEYNIIAATQKYYEQHYQLVSNGHSLALIASVISNTYAFELNQLNSFLSLSTNANDLIVSTLLNQRLSFVQSEANAFHSFYFGALSAGVPTTNIIAQMIAFNNAIELADQNSCAFQVNEAQNKNFTVSNSSVFFFTYTPTLPSTAKSNSLISIVRPLSYAFARDLSTLKQGIANLHILIGA